MKRLDLDPATFAQVARACEGDPRSPFRVGETFQVCEAGGERELHLHLSFVQKAPETGGKTIFGIVVLPYDARWNRLWAKATRELPMFRKWLWALMSNVNEEIDEELFLSAQYEDEPPPTEAPAPKKRA